MTAVRAICKDLGQSVSGATFRGMRHDGACDQPEAADQQHQHHHGFKEARRCKKNVHVGNHPSEDEERPRDGEHPSDNAAAVPEHNSDSKQHWQECNAKAVCAVEAPVRTNHLDLIGDEKSANASHEETEQEMAEPARRATHIAKGTVFHAVEDIRWRTMNSR